MSPSSGRPKRGSPPSGGKSTDADDAVPRTGDLFDAASLPVPELPTSSVPPEQSPMPASPPERRAARSARAASRRPNSQQPPAPPANTAALLRTLKAWSAQGWLRRLDSAFAGFMLDLCPDAPPPVVMAAALVAHMEGRGHSCLLIDGLLRDPEALLGWGPEAAVEFHTRRHGVRVSPRGLARAPCAASPLVWVDEWPSRAVEILAGATPTSRWSCAARSSTCGATGATSARWRRGCCSGRQAPIARGREEGPRLARPAVPAADAVDSASAATDRPIGPTQQVDWQKVACAIALRSGLSVITGGPGTGKTYTAARLLALLLALDPHPERLRVALAAPTGKAAARLKQSIGSALQELQAQGRRRTCRSRAWFAPSAPRARCIRCSARGRIRASSATTPRNPLEVDVLIVDEASMIHLEMMAALLEALPAQGAADPARRQGPAGVGGGGRRAGRPVPRRRAGRYRPETAAFVEAVSGQQFPVEFLSDGPPLAQQTVMLRDSRRFGGPIGQLALAANAGDVERATALLERAAEAPAASAGWRRGVMPSCSGSTPGRQTSQSSSRCRGGRARRAATAARAATWNCCRSARPCKTISSMPGVRGLGACASCRRSSASGVLCAVREGEWGTQQLNAAIERALAAKG